MKRMITLIMMMFLMASNASAQGQKEKKDDFVINHTVELGETVLMICKKYVVLPADFYKYNKEAAHGIKIGESLRIPLHLSKKKGMVEAYIKNVNGSYANAPQKAQVKAINTED
jgi:hypothetical protein